MPQHKTEFTVTITDVHRGTRRVLTRHHFTDPAAVEMFRMGYIAAAVNNGCTYDMSNPDAMIFIRKNGKEESMVTTTQEDEKVHNSWDFKKFIVCRACGWGLFFSRGRSLAYFNWACSNCGETCSTMTETGMSQ